MLSLPAFLTKDPLVFLPGHPSCPCSHILFPTFHKTFDNIHFFRPLYISPSSSRSYFVSTVQVSFCLLDIFRNLLCAGFIHRFKRYHLVNHFVPFPRHLQAFSIGTGKGDVVENYHFTKEVDSVGGALIPGFGGCHRYYP